MKKASFLATVAFSASIPMMAPSPAHAFFDGGGQLAALIQLISLKGTEIAELITANATAAAQLSHDTAKWIDEKLMWQQELAANRGNVQEQLAGEARMKKAEDERARQREIEREKFQAMKEVASTRAECEIRTRIKSAYIYNRPDKVASESLLTTLEEMAAWRMGSAVGDSGEPVEAASHSHRIAMELDHLESMGPRQAVAKTIYGPVQFNTDAELAACKAQVRLLSATTAEDIDESSPEKDPNSELNRMAKLEYGIRGALTDAALAQACIDRTPIDPGNDSALQAIIAAAEEMPEYNDIDFSRGISPAAARQISAQRWQVLASAPNDDGTPKTDSQKLQVMTMNIAEQSTQFAEILKILKDQHQMLSSNTSSNIEIADILRKMLELQEGAAQK
jgi:hypothetical protein